MRRLVGAAVLLILLAAGRRAAADASMIGSVGPNLQPMESTTVRLESERIDIRLRRRADDPTMLDTAGVGEYRIQFHFLPTADETATLGFPLFVMDPARNIYGRPMENLTVRVGDRTVPTETKYVTYNQKSDTRWAIFPMEFKAGQPLDLEITYSLRVDPYGKGQGAGLVVGYVLRTGANWAGNIGRIEANLSLDRPLRPEDIQTGMPVWGTTPGWTLTDRTLHWEWRDVEPDFDIWVALQNMYWLDMPQDIRAMIAGGIKDRDGLLRLAFGTLLLLDGDGRSGLPMPMRQGMSDQAGLALFPAVQTLLTEYIASHPEDWEVRDRYLQLLARSAWYTTWDGVWVLRDEGRMRTWAAEARQYRKAGGPNPSGLEFLPWYRAATNGPLLSQPTQEAVADFVQDLMPEHFPSDEAARAWVAQASGTALSFPFERLLAEAGRRVAPPTPAAVPEPGPAKPEAAPPAATPSEAPAPPSPAAHGNGWLPVAAGLAALAAAAAGAATWYRRRGRTG